MEDVISHYSSLEEDHQQYQSFDSDSNDGSDDLDIPTGGTKISAEEIIQNDDDGVMRLLTNFTIDEFNELFMIVAAAISKGVHKDTKITPKTRFLLALCYYKFNEKWSVIGFYFGLNGSYTQKITLSTIHKTAKILADKFINWISVIDRITDYNIYNADWPTLLGSLDATVQLIATSRIYEVQEAYYSGKHKIHCIKAQALVANFPSSFIQPLERSS